MTAPDQEPLPYHTGIRGERAGRGFLLAIIGQRAEGRANEAI